MHWIEQHSIVRTSEHSQKRSEVMSMGRKTASTVESRSSFYFRLAPEEDERRKEIPVEEQSVDEGKSLSSRNSCKYSGGKLNFSLRGVQIWNRKGLGKNVCGKQKYKLLHIFHMTLSHTIVLGQNTTIIGTEQPAQHSAQRDFRNKDCWRHLCRQPLTILPIVTKPLFIFLSASKYLRAPCGT